jgi:two-component system, sensor histidine kinase PdtaS
MAGRGHIKMPDPGSGEQKYRLENQASGLYFLLFQHANDAILVANEAGRYVEANRHAEILTGYSREELLEMTVVDISPPEVKALVPSMFEEFKRTGTQSGEFPIIRKDGRRTLVEFSASQVGEGRYASILRDISERKRLEELVESQLNEKKVLLQEVHHRVKNNLQTISSLLSLQASHADDSVRQVLTECQTRVQAMALIHEKLYQSQNLSNVNFQDYITDLAGHLYRSYTNSTQRIAIRLECAPIHLGIDMAIPCALILNEILSNSLKHAFPGNRTGEIRVRTQLREGRILLEISDNGIGLPPDFQ